jgi:hypothetical protein
VPCDFKFEVHQCLDSKEAFLRSAVAQPLSRPCVEGIRNLVAVCLGEIDQIRFRILMISVFRAFQSSYVLGFRSGLAPENWRSDRAALVRVLGQSGARQFCDSYKHEFEGGFVNEIDSILGEVSAVQQNETRRLAF